MPSPRPAVTVRYSELLDAFEFVSFGVQVEHGAYIDLDTGSIYYVSAEIEMEEEVPDDLETSDRYLAVPHKNDLNLGRDLVLSFVDDEIPSEYDTVAGFFRKKGAYGRYKDFLEARRLLDRWYAFEARATERALRAWSQENNIELIDGPPLA